ncbi:MAG: hypothetical protein ACTS7D_00295 [Candidatus Hodgkinia cicadicola]
MKCWINCSHPPMVSFIVRICELVNSPSATTKPHVTFSKLRFLMKRNPFVLTFARLNRR